MTGYKLSRKVMERKELDKPLPRILSIERDQSACNHYRIVQPLYHLLMNGMANILTINESNYHKFDFLVEKVREADIILLHRPADERWHNLIKVAQKYGKFIVADFDDDPFNTSPWNPAYEYYGIQEAEYELNGERFYIWKDGVDGFNIENNIQRRDLFKASFRRADMVTCTTDILKDTLLKINNNVKVLPNLIDFNIFSPVEMKKKEIRIGYTFGASHYADFYLVKPALKKIVEKYDNVKLVFFGDMHFHGLFRDVPDNKIEWHPWVGVATYPYKLMLLNLDIGICPLEDTVFNRNKSSLKWMEFSSLKIPTIATNIPPYSNTITNEKDGLLVDDDQWEDALSMLIDNSELRDKLSSNAYDNVYENHNARKSAYLWRDAYESLLKSDVKEMLK